jgi:predicted nuclease with TOPRIM domain
VIIKGRKHLSRTLKRIAAMKARQTALTFRLETLNNAVLAYFKRKHRTKFIDDDGTTWQQMQGSAAVYDDEAFKKLLHSKGVNPEDVYKKVTTETRDEAAITQLLKNKTISVKEWKQVAKIRYYNPYLRRFEPRQSKGRGDSTDTGGRLSADQTLNRVRNASKGRRDD